MQYKIRIIFACLFLFCGTLAEAQERFGTPGIAAYKRMNRHGVFSFSAGAGISSYYGDLKASNTDLWARPSIQLGVEYRLNNHLHFRSELSWYRISGADSLNDQDLSIYRRNLSFRSDNVEMNIVARYEFFNRFSRVNPRLLNPYGFVGIGFTTVNPKAQYQGEWYELRPLITEGVEYSPIALVIPFGVGVSYHIDRNWDLAFEFGYRYAFTDYLDDVSSTHLGVENIEDPIRRALSDRRPEIGIPPVEAGNQRGGPARDMYLMTGLKLMYTPDLNHRKPKFR